MSGQDLTAIAVSVAMVAIGVLHFVHPRAFERIVPPMLPSPRMLVWVSGVAEIAGGLGLLSMATRPWAAWGLIALYIAVFPANIYQAIAKIQINPRRPQPVWMLWARLPFQFVFVGVAYWLTR